MFLWQRTQQLTPNRVRTHKAQSQDIHAGLFLQILSALSFKAIKCPRLAHSWGHFIDFLEGSTSDDTSNGDLNQPESLGCFLLSKWLVLDLTCEVNSLEFHAVQLENVYS